MITKHAFHAQQAMDLDAMECSDVSSSGVILP